MSCVEINIQKINQILGAKDDELLVYSSDSILGDFVELNRFSDLVSAAVRTEDLLRLFCPVMVCKSATFVPRRCDFTSVNPIDLLTVGYVNVLNPSVYSTIGVIVHRRVYASDSVETRYVITHNDTTYLATEEALNNLIKVCIANKNLSYDAFCLNILNQIKQ